MGLIPGLRRSPAVGNDQMVNNLAAMMEKITPLENQSSILAWKIPRTEAPGGLQPMGLQRVGHK